MHDALLKIQELCHQKNFVKAELLAWSLYKENPNNFICAKALGICLMGQKKIQGALDIFLQAYALNSNDFDVTNNLSYLYIEIIDTEKAYEYGEKALALNPNSPNLI